MSGFAVSDKVVCVDDSRGETTGRKTLVKGTVYVVESVWLTRRDQILVLEIVGIDLGVNEYGKRIAFRASRFRKLEDVREENRLRREQEALA